MKAMKAWKGLLVAVLLLCSFLCVVSVNTSAVSAAGEHTHPICGKTHTDIGDHTAAKCENITYTAWDGTFASSGMPDIDYSNNDTAYIYLTRSVEITYELEIPKGKTLYLCLNGYTLTKTTMSDTWSAVILSRSGGTHFILCDCKGGGTITHADGVLGRGVRSGNSNGYDKSSFTMYGGTISGNRLNGDDGAGVFVQSGTFTMYGGKITDNHVEKSLNYGGGGVLFSSDKSFIMYGGEISNNYSVDYGGGIMAIGFGSVELHGGTISGNTSDALGGAIWSNKSVTISEGVNITGNKAVDGGGICTYNTSLTINGGNITNNTVTTGNGGGVYLNGGTFKISGNVKISGNKKGSSANNVYLPEGKTISVIDELTGTTPIGITTEAAPSSSAYVRLASGSAEYLDPAKFQYENDSNISLVTVGSSTSSLIACKHNWGTTWQADANGHWHECSLCGGKQAAAEHSGGKATCTESAVCSTCNTPYGEPLGHDFTSDVWQKDETNHWKKCSRCEATDQTAAHTWEDEITLAATCTATGIKTYTCTTCLKTKTETINAKGHNFAKKTGQAATCLDSGWEDYNVCSLCNYVTDYKQIAALGHDFTSSAWQSNADEHWKKCSRCDETTEKTAHVWKDKITTAATCTATGEKTFTCIVCSTTKTETLNALGHELIPHEAKAATCLEGGWDAYDTCSRCSYTTFEKIAALGHDKVPHTAQAATCLEIGWNAYDTCTRCSYTTYVEIGKLGHDFTSDVWQKDKNEHWKKCSRCDETEQTAEHTWNEEITLAATCTAAGLKTYTCPACLETKTETISAKGHNITQHEAKAATCTTIGWKAYEDCSDCDYTTYVEIAAYGHDFTTSVWQKDETNHWKKCSRCDETEQTAEHTWNEEITLAATCTAAGLKTYTCPACLETKTETISAKGHNITQHEAKAATCTTIGWKAYEDCSDCDYTTYVEIAAYGHDFTTSVWQKDETNHWKKCSRCEATDQTAAHTWNEEITVAATCTAAGLKTYTCTTCLETKTETISAKGHNITQHDAKAATCTTIGWKAYEDCSACDYTTYVEIPAYGHDFTSSVWQKDENEHWKKCSRCDETEQTAEHTWNDGEITIEPNCTATGRTTFTCTVCFVTKIEVIDALGHIEIPHKGRDATCTEYGWKPYVTCERCDYTTYEKISALGHDKIAHEAQDATCTTIGWKAYDTCSRCDYTTYAEIAAFGHDFSGDVWQKDESRHWKECSRCGTADTKNVHAWDTEITVAPTCTAEGLRTYTCIDCRATKTETIAANGHNLTAHEAKAATCTEFGWKVYEDCADCDYTTYVEIAAFGHDFTGSVWQQDENKHWKKCSRCDEIDQAAEHTFGDGEITLEPTCTATGLKTYTCTVCFETKTETIDALGHDEVQHDGKAATCTEFGWKPYVTCNRCEYTTHEKLNALGHDKIHHEAKAATCLEIGYNAYDTCSRCDYTTYVEIAALGHDEIHHDGKAATCTEIGWNAYDTCSRCDYTTYVEIAALGHDEIHHEAKAATCTEIGYNAYDTCSRCDYTTYEEIAALGHDEIHHEAKAATCTEIGYNAYDTCSRCDYTTYVEIAALGHDFTAATWQSNADEHWKNCARCDATAEKASHAGGTATCKDVAVCSTCSATYGELNPDNHAGGTEIRDMVEATAEKVGHTGNSYCKGCNAKIADGKVIPVTVDLSIDQKSDLETAAEAIEKFLSEQNESYTDEQKEELSGSINAIKSALESIARAEDAVSKIEAMPSAADAKPDDKTAIDAFEAAKAAYDALSDDEKRMTGDNSKTTLDAIFKALTAYAVTDGNGSTWAESDNSGLTFTVNGYHEKFAGLVINGETVDKKYYDVKAGSTVITLKAEYLKTLSAGKYTILVQYADGSTDGEDAFTVKENGSVTPPDSASSSSQPSESNSSQATESNKSIVIWIVIPILLIILLIILLLLLKNRKKSEKKK